jgi:methanogenic corrinoid protein MtbC1
MQKLLESSARLAKVSRQAAEAYDARKGLLAENVNLTMLRRQDLTELIGGTANTELMQNNHQNHILFLTTVLYLNGFRLLASVIPWVYRTYSQHGFSVAYFPVALAAWKQAVKKEIQPELAAEIIPVYDWMLSQHDQVVNLLNSPANEEERELPESAVSFLNHLLKKDTAEAVAIATNSTESEESLLHFYHDTMHPAMYEVGNRWAQGNISVAEEHLATAVAQNVIANLQTRTTKTSGQRGRAIITSATNEQHDLGARIAAHVFENDGWEVIYLGANMPISDLTHLARRIKPRFVGISVAMPYNLQHVKRIEEIFKTDPELAQIKIMVSGIVFRLFPEAAGCFKGIDVIETLEEAISIARRWALG